MLSSSSRVTTAPSTGKVVSCTGSEAIHSISSGLVEGLVEGVVELMEGDGDGNVIGIAEGVEDGVEVVAIVVVTTGHQTPLHCAHEEALCWQ